jgi:hypothetical protein
MSIHPTKCMFDAETREYTTAAAGRIGSIDSV